MGLAALLACTLPTVVSAQPDGTVRRYLTRSEALREVFPQSRTYVRDTLRLSPKEIRRTEKAIHHEVPDSTYGVTLAYDAEGSFLGYAVVDEEIGKYRPITFMVGITPEFKVKKVVVMVYREDHGQAVKTPRFLYQYKGKTAEDPIRTHRDITNISGATLSVRALNAGVRRVLHLVTTHYRSSPPPARYKRAQHSSSGPSSP